MADVNAPSDQTPIMAPPVRADDQILPHIRFYPRPDSLLHLSNEEPALGYLKFSAKGTKREIFGMPIPSKLITANIREAPYYQEYQENVAKHRGFLAGETGSTQDLHVPKPTKPARKPQSTTQKAPLKPSISSPVTSTQPALTSVPAKTQENKCKQATGTTNKPAKAKRIKRIASRKTHQPRSSPKSMVESEAKEVPAEELQVADEDANFQKVVEESMKDAYALPKGPLPPVVISELESGKYQPLPEVPGKARLKCLRSRRVSEPTASSFHDESPYEVLGQSDSKEESKKIMLRAGPDPNAQAEGQTRSDTGAQDEGQAGSNPDETSKGQARSNPDETSEGQTGPDPGNVEARVQSTSSLVVHAGSDCDHMDLDIANVLPQPSMEQLYEGFTQTVYPNVQENLKLAIEEPSMVESEAKEVPAEELQVADEDVNFQKVVEESMKDAYALPKGPLPPVVIRELESGKYQPLPEVPGKARLKCLRSRRVSEPTASSFHDESPYEVLGQSDSKEESKKIMLRVEKGSQDESQ
nr:hypothetical protein [Tanacetum cinerariifolium]